MEPQSAIGEMVRWPWPAGSLLAQGDDGSPEVWSIDGISRRHVQSMEVMSAWRFDTAAIEKWPITKLNGFESSMSLRRMAGQATRGRRPRDPGSKARMVDRAPSPEAAAAILGDGWPSPDSLL